MSERTERPRPSPQEDRKGREWIVTDERAEIVEAMAAAMCDNDHVPDQGWIAAGKNERDDYRESARVALDAALPLVLRVSERAVRGLHADMTDLPELWREMSDEDKADWHGSANATFAARRAELERKP